MTGALICCRPVLPLLPLPLEFRPYPYPSNGLVDRPPSPRPPLMSGNAPAAAMSGLLPLMTGLERSEGER